MRMRRIIMQSTYLLRPLQGPCPLLLQEYLVLLLLELRELLVVSQTLLLLRQGPLRWKSKVVMAQEEEWLVVVVVVHLS